MVGRSFLSTTRAGIARLTEGEPPDEHLREEDVHSLAVGPTGSDLVLAGTEGNGVFRSRDRGRTWTASGLDGQTVTSLAVAPGDVDRVYAGVRPPAVYRSDDGGATWTECESFRGIRGRRLWRSPASPPFTAYVQALAVSPVDPDLVVAGIEFGAVVRSTDGGETWRRPDEGLDRGYGWAVAAHPEDPDIWYVSASTGPFAAHGDGDAKAAVFRRDGDHEWVRLDGIPGGSMPYALVTDPAKPDHLWAGSADGSIRHSPNRGENWDRLAGTLPAVERAMVMLPPG